MDRGLYDVSVLADPSAGWAPWASQPGWNHKVLYQFGGGTAPWHTNGAPQNDVVDLALSRGFMVANNNLNIRGNDANDVVSAEALMMLKEHIVETYGAHPLHDRHGLLGRLDPAARRSPPTIPACSTASSRTAASRTAGRRRTRSTTATSCATTSALPGFTAAQQAAVMGVRDPGVCTAWDLELRARRHSLTRVELQPAPERRSRRSCTTRCRIPTECAATCRTTSRRSGASGRATASPAARSPTWASSTGSVRLNAGTITPDQFVALNAERRRYRHRPQLHGGPLRAGSRRAVDRVPHGSGHERRAARERADHRPARLRASLQRHPHRLPLVRHAGPARRGERRARQPADLDVGRSVRADEHRASALDRAEVVPHDGQLALDDRVGHTRRSALAEGARRQAGDGVRRVLHRRGADRDDRSRDVRGGVPALRRRAARGR